MTTLSLVKAPGLPSKLVDVRDKTITTYIVHELMLAMRTMREGEIVDVVTEPLEAVENDLRAWCRMTGQELVSLVRDAAEYRFCIRKTHDLGPRDRDLAMVISNDGLEELLAPLGFALAAALAGTRVHLHFQGPAVHVLTAGFKPALHGLSRPFSSFARKELAEEGHVAPRVKLTQLHELGARFYVCGASMAHFGARRDDLIFPDVVIGEYLTFLDVMEQADIRFFLQ